MTDSVGEDPVSESEQAAAVLRAMAHAQRLDILCLLLNGPLAVGEITRRLALRGPAVSQQLAVLRGHRLVKQSRAGKQIYYRIGDQAVTDIISTLRTHFCKVGA